MKPARTRRNSTHNFFEVLASHWRLPSVCAYFGLSPAAEFSVLVHELAHELLHWNDHRLETRKAIKETEAEAVAFIVSRAMGLECSTAASDYIQLCNGTVEILETSLDGIRKVDSKIIASLTPTEESRRPNNPVNNGFKSRNEDVSSKRAKIAPTFRDNAQHLRIDTANSFKKHVVRILHY